MNLEIEQKMLVLSGSCVGAFVDSASAGGGAGSILNIHTSNGVVLMIYCFWRLVSSNAVVASAASDTSLPDGLMISKLRQLEGSMISSFDLLNLDFKINFSNGQVLEVYCESDGASDDEDWWLALPSSDVSYVILHGAVTAGTYF
jgi:hypothetical protein